jgi:hypothetical protein
MKQFLFLCILFFSVAVSAQKLDDYKTVKGDKLLWSNLSSWNVFDGKKWVDATAIPDSKVGIITIEKGSTVIYDSTLNTLMVDELKVYGELIINVGVTLKIANANSTDIVVNDGGLLNNQGTIAFDKGAKWELAPEATYIHSSSIQGGYGALVAASLNTNSGTWIVRRVDKTFPNISFAGRIFKNLTIENFYSGIANFSVGQSTLGLTVTGILNIGGNGIYPVKLDIRNYTGEIKIGETKIKDGSFLLKN